MIDLNEIQKAADAIAGQIFKTPLVFSPTLSHRFGGDIYLKLENLQRTGSFKIRGAMYKLLAARETIGPAGVVAASAGNHAQGVALAARLANVPATIVMPEWASISKQEATRNYGGEVIIAGRNVGESLERANALARDGRTFVHPFDDAQIIAGQGTVALEILAELPDADLIVAPVGGGGLIAGLATAAKALRPQIKVVGVQADGCPSAIAARAKGRAVRVPARPSIADGITVRQTGELTFTILARWVDDVVAVDEEHIAAAILMLLERKKTLAEGAGAVPLAALLSGALQVPAGAKTVLVVSGGNVDSPLLGRILHQGLLKHRRIMRVSVRLKDAPGALARLLTRVAELEANVLNIFHDRNVVDLPINMTRVVLEMETRDAAHADTVGHRLLQAGYELEAEVANARL